MALPASCCMLLTPVVDGGKALSSACVISTALHQPQGLKYHNIKPLRCGTWMHPDETGRDTSLCLWKWIGGSTNVKHHTWKRSLQFLSGIKGSFTIIWNEFCQVEKKNECLDGEIALLPYGSHLPRWRSQTSVCADKVTDGVFHCFCAELKPGVTALLWVIQYGPHL